MSLSVAFDYKFYTLLVVDGQIIFDYKKEDGYDLFLDIMTDEMLGWHVITVHSWNSGLLIVTL